MIPAIHKLLDYVAGGIGNVAGPLLAPWATRRRAKAALVPEGATTWVASGGSAKRTVQIAALPWTDFFYG